MAGRRNLYDTNIKPNFDKIDKMLNDGATEKQCAEACGISYPSWNNYKVQYEEFGALCRKPRTKLIDDLRGALVKRALGFTYEEKKQYIKEDEDGSKAKYTEITTKQALPDCTAIFGALNLYDPEYVKDKKNYDLKKQELELRREMAENKDW